MSRIIDGKVISASVKERVKNGVAELNNKGITVGLAVIIVGDDPASKIYVANKKKACEAAGMNSRVIELSESTTQEELLACVNELAEDSTVHGILVQLPLPKHLDENAVIAAIPPEKDVDAFTTENVGRIMLGDFDFLPCTPAGIMTMLSREGIEITGKRCVVIGRSNIVGKPMAMLLLHANGTVTVCHSRTQSLAEVTREADILVVAIGKARFVTADMVKDGAIVIDVGMNRNAENKLCGDVKYDEVAPKCSYIKLTAFCPAILAPHLLNTVLTKLIVLFGLSVKHLTIKLLPPCANASYSTTSKFSTSPFLALSIFLLITSAGTCSLLAFSIILLNTSLLVGSGLPLAAFIISFA